MENTNARDREGLVISIDDNGVRSAVITHMGKGVRAACDGKCSKAWGIRERPKVMLSDDDHDWAYLSDKELEDAPSNPDTYKDGIGKPKSPNEFPNKWCISECERCFFSQPGEWMDDMSASDLPDFSKRLHNKSLQIIRCFTFPT